MRPTFRFLNQPINTRHVLLTALSVVCLQSGPALAQVPAPDFWIDTGWISPYASVDYQVQGPPGTPFSVGYSLIGPTTQPPKEIIEAIPFTPINAQFFASASMDFSGGPFGAGSHCDAPVAGLFIGTYVGMVGNTLHYDTEMLQLDITGGTLPPGVRIRESLLQQSTGHTTVEPLGGGIYQVSSFFDVFTELSLDGGLSWTPGSNPDHVVLTPEPGSLMLCAASLLVLRRKRNRLA